MNRVRLFIFVLSFFCLSTANSQNWTQLTNVGGSVRNAASGFSIGNYGYIGLGYDGAGMVQDFWKYDPVANTWTQVANFGGAGRFGAVSFSIGTKGYCGLGSTGYPAYNFVTDFYEYDAPTNTWTQLGNFPGPGRYTVASFVINNKGYMGTGWAPYYDDFWEYNPVTDIWLQKANFIGGMRQSTVGFSIGNNGYIGTGNNGANFADFYKYDPATNAWTAIASFPAAIRYGSISFVIGSTAYVGTGGNGASYFSDFYSYDAGTNSWTAIASYPGPGVRHAPSFTIGNCGYFGTGVSASGITNTFWKFCPCNTVADIAGPTQACAGSQVIFTNNSTGASSYLWQFGDGDTLTSSASQILHTYAGTGIYHVKIIGNSTCGNDTDEIILNVFNINGNINSTDISCFGAHDGSASVTNPMPGQAYTWNPGALHSALISNLDTGSYTLNIVDSLGCQATVNTYISQPPPLSINITSQNTGCHGPGQASAAVSGGMPPYQYSWNTIPISTTSSISGLDTGTYIVNVFDLNGCSISDTVQKTSTFFQTKYYLTNQHCSSVFSFYDQSFGVHGHANNWLWNFGDNSFSTDSTPVHQYVTPGDYNVTLIASVDSACPDSMTKVVHVLRNPISNFTLNLDTCKYTITTKNNSQFHSSSRWDFGDYWNSFDKDGSHHYLNDGDYDVHLIVSTDSICEDTLSIHISIPPLAEPDFSFKVPPCDSLVSFTNHSINAISCLWEFGDGDTSSLDSPNHKYSISGEVPVKLISYSSYGCLTELDRSIYFVIRKEAEFNATLDSCSGLVNFYDVTYGAAKYYWKFGDGTTSTEYIPKHNYGKDGEYYVVLIVNPESQCADSIGRMVSNEEPLGEKVFIPNTFTPNGDGHNDIFHPSIFRSCEIYKLTIFNRWGQVVFESEDASEVFWDGSYKGEPMPNDLYVYLLKGEEKTQNGFINILR